MKRKLYIVCSVVLIIMIIIILMFTGILPNIFVDRSDLVCSRIYIQTDAFTWYQDTVIKFNNKGFVKMGNVVNKNVYSDEKTALKNYEQLKNSITGEDEIDAKLENNILVTDNKIEISLEQEKMNKKEIKKVYEGYGYECK